MSLGQCPMTVIAGRGDSSELPLEVRSCMTNDSLGWPRLGSHKIRIGDLVGSKQNLIGNEH